MHVQPFVPWRSILPCDIPSFGFAGQSMTAACSLMLSGPALSAFAIFHSSECADVVNVPGGRGAVAVERSSAKTTDDIVVRTIAPYRKSLVMRASIILDLNSSRSGVQGKRRSGAIHIHRLNIDQDPRRARASRAPRQCILHRGIPRSASRFTLVLLNTGPMKRARLRLGSFSRAEPTWKRPSKNEIKQLADLTIIASTRDNLGHKSNRKLALVHGRVDNPFCNLSTWFLKAWRHRTTTNPNRRPTICCRDGCFYCPSS